VKAFDPLFVTKKSTGFESEPSAELFTPQIIPWSVPNEANSEKQKSNIIINISLLPEEYRRNNGISGLNYQKARYINENEGISILRNDREVFYGTIPYAPKLGSSEADQDVNRWIGCEISFEAELDHEFEVKNIKRGAKPVRELKDKIVERISPTFTTLRAKIRDKWSEIKRESESNLSDENAGIGVSDLHSITNRFLKETKETFLKNNKNNKKENDEKIAIKVKPGASSQQIQEVIEALKSNGITIDEREFIGDSFIDIEHGNQLKTLFYNTNSTFYKAYSDILNELKLQNEDLANKYRVLLDLVFVGYMLAESAIDPNETMDGASFSDELKQYWSLNLSKILKKWNS
jgi:hypothetical protein